MIDDESLPNHFKPSNLRAWVSIILAFALASACAGGPVVDEDQVPLGNQLYTENCQTCHGTAATGNGGIERAPSHGPQGHTWHHADGQLTAIILGQFNYPGRAMPSFEGTLTEAEVSAILSYLKSNWSEDQLTYQAEVSRNWEDLQQ